MPLSTDHTQLNPPLIRLLDSVGDGTGNKAFNLDYSAVAGQAIIKPPDNQIFVLHSFLIQYSDGGNFIQSVYGSLAAALTVGLIIGAYDRDDNLILSLTNGEPVKTNDQWLHLGYETVLQEWGVANTTTLTGTMDHRTFGTAFALNGNNGEYLKVTLNDNFTGLIDQTFLAKGYITQ